MNDALSGLRRLIGRPVQERFSAAVPSHRGDRLLLSLIGQLSSNRGVAEKIYGEGETFLIKGALFLTGVRMDPSAFEGVGDRWKEDLGQAHFNPNARARRSRLPPYALWLPHGLYTPLYLDGRSPFLLRRERGTLYLYLEGLRLFPVEYERRPSYYEQETSSGVPMSHIGPHRLQRQVLIEYGTYCRFFSNDTQCLFCGIIGERPLHHGHYQRFFTASPQEAAEVVDAAYSQGDSSEMEVTGGVIPDRAEVGYILEVGRAMQERLRTATVPGSQAVMVPPDLPQIDELKSAGWEAVSFNLEVWDPRLWPGIVPGKAEVLPREGWLEALEYAVQVFGKGNVSTVLVAGLEPKQAHWAGVEWLAQRGVYGVPIPWTPTPSSLLEGHQTPGAAWHLEVAARDLDIWEKYGLNPHRHTSGGFHYDDLATMREHLRELQADRPDVDVTKDLRHTLAVEGKLPDL